MQNLDKIERIFYRDSLREARNSVISSSDGFQKICFAIESLGLRLLGRKADLGNYAGKINQLSKSSISLHKFSEKFPSNFTKFDVLFEKVRIARNDAMHTGAYARNATAAAIELCLGLEEALMSNKSPLKYVKDFLVKNPVTIESWQPVAYARQLMLLHSFSYLPVFIENEWKLISELSIAKYIRTNDDDSPWSELLAKPINEATKNGLSLIKAPTLAEDEFVNDILKITDESKITLWLIPDKNNNGILHGVISPYELV